jgi:hypothetical protein
MMEVGQLCLSLKDKIGKRICRILDTLLASVQDVRVKHRRLNVLVPPLPLLGMRFISAEETSRE